MPKKTTKAEPIIKQELITEQETQNEPINDVSHDSDVSSSSSSSDAVQVLEKPKKPRTEKQIEAWTKALEARKLNNMKKQELKQLAKDTETKELVIKKTRAEQRAERQKKLDDKLIELEAKAIPLTESISEKKKPKRKTVVYLNSDDEQSEEEVPSKSPIVIINKMAPHPTHIKKVIEKPNKIPVFV